MHGVSPATQQVTALEAGVKTLQEIYGELDSFVNKGTDPPNWTNLLTRFRGGIGQIQQVSEAWQAEGNGST